MKLICFMFRNASSRCPGSCNGWLIISGLHRTAGFRELFLLQPAIWGLLSGSLFHLTLAFSASVSTQRLIKCSFCFCCRRLFSSGMINIQDTAVPRQMFLGIAVRWGENRSLFYYFCNGTCFVSSAVIHTCLLAVFYLNVHGAAHVHRCISSTNLIKVVV